MDPSIDDVDYVSIVGLNNYIARAVSPHSPNLSIEKFNRKDTVVTSRPQTSEHSDQFSVIHLERETPSLSGRETPQFSGRETPQSGRETPIDRPRYQLWPILKKVVGPRKPSEEEDLSLAMSRSVPMLRREPSSDSMDTRMRAGSLPRRRKVSIPELGRCQMTTLHEKQNDSPTIPGRFQVHERSNSAPAQNVRRFVQTGSNLSPVVDLTPNFKPVEGRPFMLTENELLSSARSVKRASSCLLPEDDDIILLPAATFDPNQVAGPSQQAPLTENNGDAPPAVPPKSPRLKLRINPVNAPMPVRVPDSEIAQRNQQTLQAGPSLSTTESGISPNPFTNWGFSNPRARNGPSNDKTFSPCTSATSSSSHKHTGSASTTQTTPISATQKMTRPQNVAQLQRTRSNSDGSVFNFSYKHKRQDSEGSVLDRGRPTRRVEGIVKKKLTSRFAAPDQSFGTLPDGVLPSAAASQFPSGEIEGLYHQAKKQAETFQVLPRSEVKTLSRELRSLDERCDYLLKTHNSLREGRKELHARMIAYLKSPRLAKFSRESMLKQEVALAELDKSIDEWIVKLEYAENRRSRVRQKVLEHVAAALLLPVNTQNQPSPCSDAQTPPRSPEKAESLSGVDRVESIKIYAGKEVYALLADIEQEIENMVEQGPVQ